MSRTSRAAIWAAAGIASLMLLAVIAGVALVRTQWFRDRVRDRIVSEVERASGGRAGIGSFEFDWKTLTAKVAPFVLHGKEAAGEQPLFRAKSITVGLKIVSILKRDIDIASLVLEKPHGHVIVLPDGTTNLPEPKIPWHSDKSFTERILDLAIKKCVVRDGLLEFNDRKIPLNLEADRLNVDIVYEAAAPRYRGSIRSDRVSLEAPRAQPASFGFETEFALEKDRVTISKSRVSMGASSVELAGIVEHLSSPAGVFDVRAKVLPADIKQLVKLPIGAPGTISFNGKAAFRSSPLNYQLDGTLSGRGLSYRDARVSVSNAVVDAKLRVTPEELRASGIRLRAMGGTFDGDLQLRRMTDFRVDGKIGGFQIRDLAKIGTRKDVPWNGAVSGPLHVEGKLVNGGVRDITSQARLDIAPAASGGIPVSGGVDINVDINYDQRTSMVRLGDSLLSAGSTQAEISGTLGQSLHVILTTQNLNDLLPAFALAGETPAEKLPVELKNGTAHLDATVDGPLRNPMIAGHLEALHISVKNRAIDSIDANFAVTASALNVKSMDVRQGAARARGSGRLGLNQWKPSGASPVDASLTLKGAALESLLAEFGRKLPISGALSAEADVRGTFANPSADIEATATGVTAYGEKISTATAEIRYFPETLDLVRGRMEEDGARIDASGKFDHPRNDLRNGEAQFQIASAGIRLARIEHVRQVCQDVDGQVQLQANGTARLVNGIAQLETLKSETDLHNFSIAGERLGDATLAANTKGAELTATVNGTIGETKIQGRGEWTLEGDYPGQGSLEFSRTTFAELQRLTARATKIERLPFEGFLEGSATVRGPLKKPENLRAELRIPVIEMDPNPELRPRAGASAKDLLLKNDGPVVLEGNTRSIDIKSAKFSAKDTSIEAAGTFALDSTTPWNLTAKGSINLAILQLFNADVLGSGHASIDARARGTINDPQVAGRMNLNDASLYLNNVPNGIDHANGAIIFDRNRATIEHLSAQTGGGQITLGGFVGFTHPVLTYRLFAHAEQVRYRSPEGISLTANADLSMSGTSDISILSGTVDVTRVAFNPRTDVGALLAETAKPIAISQNPNEYLRGVQLDIRVQNAQTLEIDTALTSNVQAEADVRIRGNLQRPSILGTMSVTEGRIEFFGNKYAITRGEVHFYNLARIEPVIDFDLETEVRGVTVNVSFSGPINKLNLTYRSDPPLDTNQIVALLAVGRSPSMSSGLESTQTSQSNFMATGTNALLSQAIAAPASGRLQRFFGVSHLKIDPELNDLSSIPQARLTLEQQVSRDITLTYITNLARTDEQIVRIEWDLSRKWSVVALRDENGEFGVNFQYRKQFK